MAQMYRYSNVYVSFGITNLTRNEFVLINHLNYPSMPVSVALRISMSLPPIFTPFRQTYIIKEIDIDDKHVTKDGNDMVYFSDREGNRVRAKIVRSNKNTLTVGIVEDALLCDGGVLNNYPMALVSKMFPEGTHLGIRMEWEHAPGTSL